MKTTVLKQQMNDKQYVVHPHKLLMWVFIAAICMLFAGLTSAYIVKKADAKQWIDFRMPIDFLYSTIVIVASSITLYFAARAARKDEIKKVQIGVGITLILAVSFCFFQYFAAQYLVSHNIFFSGDSVSYSFIYVLAGLHLLHILGGVIVLIIAAVKSLQYKIHKKNMLFIELTSTYWHFVGLLWVYLYTFFSLA